MKGKAYQGNRCWFDGADTWGIREDWGRRTWKDGLELEYNSLDVILLSLESRMFLVVLPTPVLYHNYLAVYFFFSPTRSQVL